MIYVYDIVLNLNKEIIEFFEWEENDNIKYIRKIPFFRVSNNFMKDLITKKIKVNDSFLKQIENKTLFDEDYSDNDNYMVLLSDDNIILGVSFNKEGENIYLSRVLLDDEDEILLLGNRLNKENVCYKVIEKKEFSNDLLTRKELKIKKSLEKEFKQLYDSNKIDKLNYYYFEYFNSIDNNKDNVYKKLTQSLNENFDEKFIDLYKIKKMSYQHR